MTWFQAYTSSYELLRILSPQKITVGQPPIGPLGDEDPITLRTFLGREDWPRCIIFFMRMLQILRGLCVACDPCAEIVVWCLVSSGFITISPSNSIWGLGIWWYTGIQWDRMGYNEDNMEKLLPTHCDVVAGWWFIVTYLDEWFWPGLSFFEICIHLLCFLGIQLKHESDMLTFLRS